MPYPFGAAGSGGRGARPSAGPHAAATVLDRHESSGGPRSAGRRRRRSATSTPWARNALIVPSPPFSTYRNRPSGVNVSSAGAPPVVPATRLAQAEQPRSVDRVPRHGVAARVRHEDVVPVRAQRRPADGRLSVGHRGGAHRDRAGAVTPRTRRPRSRRHRRRTPRSAPDTGRRRRTRTGSARRTGAWPARSPSPMRRTRYVSMRFVFFSVTTSTWPARPKSISAGPTPEPLSGRVEPAMGCRPARPQPEAADVVAARVHDVGEIALHRDADRRRSRPRRRCSPTGRRASW